MGDAPNEIDVLECKTLTDTDLKYVRHRICEDDSFVYAFHETPDDPSFADLADGALFVQYKQSPGSFREPPVAKRFPGGPTPVTQDGWVKWTLTLDVPPNETEEQAADRKRAEILFALVLPPGYTAADFGVWPAEVKAAGDRIVFLFNPTNEDGKFVITWRMAKVRLPIRGEVQSAFEAIRKHDDARAIAAQFPAYDKERRAPPSSPGSAREGAAPASAKAGAATPPLPKGLVATAFAAIVFVALGLSLYGTARCGLKSISLSWKSGFAAAFGACPGAPPASDLPQKPPPAPQR